VRPLGVEKVIDYHTAKFEDVVKDVDAVTDTVGGDLLERSMRVIRPGGVYATPAGRVDPETGQVHGIRATSPHRADVAKLQLIITLLQSKQITSLVGQVFPLTQAQQAQELSHTGHGRGRIVLHCASRAAYVALSCEQRAAIPPKQGP
jgi:NADPH:quinone reductase-like Zn-dependent oxidoreductase